MLLSTAWWSFVFEKRNAAYCPALGGGLDKMVKSIKGHWLIISPSYLPGDASGVQE
jgi:hypothetical protein